MLNIEANTPFIIIAEITGGIILQIIFAIWLTEYKRELKYLKIEIKRSRGPELVYWKKQKRTLWFRVLLNILK